MNTGPRDEWKRARASGRFSMGQAWEARVYLPRFDVPSESRAFADGSVEPDSCTVLPAAVAEPERCSRFLRQESKSSENLR